MIAEENEDGRTLFSYYLYDAENDSLADTPICTMERSEDIPVFKLGAMIAESPFGLRSNYMANIGTVEVILPLSAAVGIPEDYLPLASACVFLIVFITMFYAATKLRKDNPIDAIRMETN